MHFFFRSGSGVSEEEDVRLIEGSPQWWYVRYMGEEELGSHCSHTADPTKSDPVRHRPSFWATHDRGADDGGGARIQKDTRAGLLVSLSPYPPYDRNGREAERRYLCTDSRGDVVVSAAWQPGENGAERDRCREWLMRWYEPRWPAVLALLEAELHDLRTNISRAALLPPSGSPSLDSSVAHGQASGSSSASSSSSLSSGSPGNATPGGSGAGISGMVSQLQNLLHSMCDKSQYSVAL